MSKPFRVIQVGFGSLGRHIASAVLKRNNLELVAVVDANPDLKNKTIGECQNFMINIILKSLKMMEK